MAHYVDEDDRDDDDDDSLDEDPLESDQDPEADAADLEDAVLCPFCKRSIHEDADVCPRCGNFVGGADAPRPRVPPLVWVGVVLAGLCVLTWVLIR